MLWIVLVTLLVVSITWMFWGYSLAFGGGVGSEGNAFIGDLKHFGLIGGQSHYLINCNLLTLYRSVMEQPSVGSPRIPAIVFSLYQMAFACVTPALWLPAAAERGRLLPVIVLIFLWSTLVYSPIAHMHWHPAGVFGRHSLADTGSQSHPAFTAKLGVLDFAGGAPVQSVIL